MEDGLRQVIDEALAANLELRASGATVQQRLAALDQARARYLPVIDFAARYSMADGGRTIEFPVGDLLDPVYETLDQMLLAQGQAPQLPRVQNQSIAFLRDQEQETKLLLEQPLYEPRIGRPSTRLGPTPRVPKRTLPRCGRRSSATSSRRTTAGSRHSRP